MYLVGSGQATNRTEKYLLTMEFSTPTIIVIKFAPNHSNMTFLECSNTLLMITITIEHLGTAKQIFFEKRRHCIPAMSSIRASKSKIQQFEGQPRGVSSLFRCVGLQTSHWTVVHILNTNTLGTPL